MLESKRSESPWSFPIVVVDKKYGGHRFCLDFRKLNAILNPLATPRPLIDNILALLGRSKCFSTIDLRSEYWQVVLDEADREKAAFVCHMGLFQFKIMPIGISQQLISIVLSGTEVFAMAYFDNILILSEIPNNILTTWSRSWGVSGSMA